MAYYLQYFLRDYFFFFFLDEAYYLQYLMVELKKCKNKHLKEVGFVHGFNTPRVMKPG